MNAKSAVDGEQLEADVQRALSGAEDMLKEAANATGEKAAELRGRALQQLRSVREKLRGAQDAVVERSRHAAHVADDYVHENPGRSISASAVSGIALGVVIGLLINRRW